MVAAGEDIGRNPPPRTATTRRPRIGRCMYAQLTTSVPAPHPAGGPDHLAVVRAGQEAFGRLPWLAFVFRLARFFLARVDIVVTRP